MKQKDFCKKHIGTFAFGLCMVAVLLFGAMKTTAHAEEKTIKYEPNYTYSSETYVDTETQEKIAPEMEGYLFGGWYTFDGASYQVVRFPEEGATYYAKFVPSEVLDVKAQVSSTLTDDNSKNDRKASLRLVTTVDSIYYSEVGFTYEIKVSNKTIKSGTLQSNEVYRQLYAVGSKENEVLNYAPEEEFCAESQYFKTITVKNIPKSAFDGEITARPFWVTVDGTRIEGAKSIKSVNLGRSWVYIGSGEVLNANEEEYGTYNHPYSDFSKALDSITLKENGKIYIRKNSNVQVDSTFKWAQRGYDITILGENGATETLDFSAIQYLVMGDGVTFSNMTLKYFGHNDAEYDGKVFANGNRFKISENVVSNNSRTYMFGGGYDSSSVEETDITILAGTYKNVYGGANATSSEKVAVVTGDTHITFGGTASAKYVSGAGASNSNVKGTCHVEFTGGTAVEGIYGGGTNSSAQNADTVVIMSGGTTQQVFGGNQAGMTGNVNLEITGGTVTRRIYGGCYNELNETTGEWVTDNYVEGIITVVIKEEAKPECSKLLTLDKGILACSRRAENAEDEVGILIFNDALFNTYGSKVGSSNLTAISPYDYLVKATSNGDVSVNTNVLESEAVLAITPEEAETFVSLTDTNNSKSTYIKGEGVCALPSFAENQTSSVVEIDFTPSDIQGAVEQCKACIDNIYYSELEDAVNFAKLRKDAPIVTLLNDASVDNTFVISKGQTLKIQSEDNTITETNLANAIFNVEAGGALEATGLNLTGGGNAIYSKGTLTVSDIYIHDIAGVGIYQTAGTTDGENIEIKNAAKFGVFVTAGKADFNNLVINNVGTDGSGRYAIKCQGTGELLFSSANITGMTSGGGIAVSENAKLNGSDVFIDETKTQGILTEGDAEVKLAQFDVFNTTGVALKCGVRSNTILTEGNISSKSDIGVLTDGTAQLTATNVNVNRTSGNAKTLIVVNSGSTFTLKEEIGISVINGMPSEEGTFTGRGVEVGGTFDFYGGTITNNNTTSSNGAGILVKAGGVVNMYGGNVTNNTAPNGGGVSLEGTAAVAEAEETPAQDAVLATFNLIGGNISENTVKTAGGGVYITNGTLTMPTTSTGSISNNEGTTDGGGIYLGANATFDMYNGNVSENELHTSSARGGGVCINSADAVFTLYGGNINGNIARAGGGVIIRTGEFVMNGGCIYGNQANKINGSAGQGGAVYILKDTFSMNGGDITNNTAQSAGAAIFANNGTFNWNGGTFTGYAANSVDGTSGKLTVNIKNSIPENERLVINSTKMKEVNIVEE